MSVVVVPAKAGHEVKRNTIQYFQFFFWTSAFAGVTLFNRFEIGSQVLPTQILFEWIQIFFSRINNQADRESNYEL